MTDAKSGLGIAQAWYDTWSGTGRPIDETQHLDDTWPAPGSTYAWCTTFLDYDFEWSALLRICTTADVEKHIEIVDMLAVIEIEGKLNVEWWNNPRLFFDQTSHWMEDARMWFVDLDHALRRSHNKHLLVNRYGDKGAAEFLRQRAERQRQWRKEAKEAGLQLPYFNEVDLRCRHCDAEVYQPEDGTWYDDSGSFTCPLGEGRLSLVTLHTPRKNGND
jgi:hypothetical protein